MYVVSTRLTSSYPNWQFVTEVAKAILVLTTMTERFVFISEYEAITVKYMKKKRRKKKSRIVSDVFQKE